MEHYPAGHKNRSKPSLNRDGHIDSAQAVPISRQGLRRCAHPRRSFVTRRKHDANRKHAGAA